VKETDMLPSRLLCIALSAAVVPASALAQPAAVQTIHLSSYRILPSAIQLAAGRPVTLVFANDSGSGHDFTAKEFFANSRIVAGAAPGGQVELRGHESKSVTLIPAAGTYAAHCSHFLHASFGMKGVIVVR
jgi:plastocyanin